MHEQTVSKSFGLDSPMVEHMSFSKQKATLAQKTKAGQNWLEKASNSLCPPVQTQGPQRPPWQGQGYTSGGHTHLQGLQKLGSIILGLDSPVFGAGQPR